MADRYWVGGSGTWDTTTTTNWSTSSGGTSGASVPTATDSVFFDQAGTYTVTFATTGILLCLDWNVTAGSVIFSNSATSTINIYGNLNWSGFTDMSFSNLANGMGWQFLGSFTTKTINTSNVVIPGNPTNFGGSSCVYNLASNFSNSLNLNINFSNTVNTNNYSVTSSGLGTVGTLNCGSSTITLTGGYFTGTAPIINSNTSTFIFSSTAAITEFTNSITTPYDFYNLSFTGTPGSSVTHTLSAAFNVRGTLSIAAPLVGNLQLSLGGSSYSINSIVTTETSALQRVQIVSDVVGITRNITGVTSTSISDIDFRDIFITGTAAPISGTRLGDAGNNKNITFAAAKTVYWSNTVSTNWQTNSWSNTSGGTANTIYYPLAQDTAIINNTGLVTSGTITIGSTNTFCPTIDMSSRTNSMTFATGSITPTFCGNFICGSGTTLSGSGGPFSGHGKTQSITSAGKTFFSVVNVTNFGGTVQLNDAFTGTTFSVNAGIFKTNNFNLTLASTFNAPGTTPREIYFGSSTINSLVTFTSSLSNLIFNAGTSNIIFTLNGSSPFNPGGLTFYNYTVNASLNSALSISGTGTFNNLTITTSSAVGLSTVSLSNNLVVNGTLSIGSNQTKRTKVISSTLGTPITLTVNALNSNSYVDFQDITIAGTATGTTMANAGDCGGNSGITFPTPKTVYWNLAGTQNWSSTGWATTSGGTPAATNFPLAQDTAIFNDAGSAGTVAIDQSWTIKNIDFSARTTTMTIAGTGSLNVFGNFTNSSAIINTNAFSSFVFCGRITQTITSNGGTTGNITINTLSSNTVQISDAYAGGTLTFLQGIFNAQTYNVTIVSFTSNLTTLPIHLKMGSGLWTFTGTGTVFLYGNSNVSLPANITHDPGTANILLSASGTTSRAINGSGSTFNKITIGGVGISRTDFTWSVYMTELASTKTTAHTIGFWSSGGVNGIGKWSVTGSAGNLVSVDRAGTANGGGFDVYEIAPSVDYLSVSYFILGTTYKEFYCGANSVNVISNTGTIVFANPPTPRTLYWIGGTGNWSDTAHWSTSSGGTGGAAIPTSYDNVIFNSASSAAAYTLTVDVSAKCAGMNMAGPAAGNITWAGTTSMSFSGNVTLSATGITKSHSGGLYFIGPTGSSYTLTTNGNSLSGSSIYFDGLGTWSLGSALTAASVFFYQGTFNTANFSVTLTSTNTSNNKLKTLNFGSSTISSINGFAWVGSGLTFNAGTSQLNITGNVTPSVGTSLYPLTFYNVSFNSGILGGPYSLGTITASTGGGHTFNDLTVVAPNNGVNSIILYNNITVNGTLTISGSDAIHRNFLYSSSIGVPRTITANAILANYSDLRDIVISGTAAGASLTGAGDCGGNSGITFPTPKTVYWNLAGTQNWSSTGWATTSGGTPALANFPLAQDTAIFNDAGAITTLTIDQKYAIGTMDASGRTSAMTFNTGPVLNIYGDWKFGTGLTISSTNFLTFAGRSTQTIISNGISFTQPIEINTTPTGIVQLGDALSISGNTSGITLTQGTFNAVIYNVTVAYLSSALTSPRTLNMGSGTWTLNYAGTVWNYGQVGTTTLPTGLTHNSNTANILITDNSTTQKAINGSGATFNKLTIGGNTGTSTLQIYGHNTFSEIASTKTVAHTISLGNNIQKVGKWSVVGTSGNLVSITGTSASSPAGLVYTGNSRLYLKYFNVSNVRAYSSKNKWLDTWYVGNSSTNNGSYGFLFSDPPIYGNFTAFFAFNF